MPVGAIGRALRRRASAASTPGAPAARGQAAVAVLACVVLVGCGDGGDETTTAPPTGATGTTERSQGEEASQPAAGAAAAGEQASPDAPAPPEAERPLAPEEVIRAVLTDAGSPQQACRKLVTERFVREAYGSRQGCLAARVPGATAREVRIRDLRESGERAHAVAVPRGGPYDGIEVEVELVADQGLEGAWLVESLVADVPPGP